MYYVWSELATFEFKLDEDTSTAEKVADAWDQLKHNLALGILRHKKAAKKSLKNTYRKRLKRLCRRYKSQLDSEADAVLVGQETRGQRMTTPLIICCTRSQRQSKIGYGQSSVEYSSPILGGEGRPRRQCFNVSPVDLGTTSYLRFA